MGIKVVILSLLISTTVSGKSMPTMVDNIMLVNPHLTEVQATQIAASIYQYSAVYEIDPKLTAAIIMVESKFNPRARGSKGEIGLMQLRPQFHSKNNPKALYDPCFNIARGVKYLSALRDIFEDRYGPIKWTEFYNLGPNKRPKRFYYSDRVKKEYLALGGVL